MIIWWLFMLNNVTFLLRHRLLFLFGFPWFARFRDCSLTIYWLFCRRFYLFLFALTLGLRRRQLRRNSNRHLFIIIWNRLTY
jgi:hypothetical protein